jgi:hypothetical protein
MDFCYTASFVAPGVPGAAARFGVQDDEEYY